MSELKMSIVRLDIRKIYWGSIGRKIVFEFRTTFS